MTTEQQNKIRKTLERMLPAALTRFTDELDALAKQIADAAFLVEEKAKLIRAWAYFEAIDNLVAWRRQGRFSFGVAGHGNCYEAALKTMAVTADGDGMEMILVHGEFNVKGVMQPHAWLEVGDVVVDPSNFRDWPLVIAKARFYRDCGIDPAKQKRYTRAQAAEANKKTGILGPWPDNPPAA